MKLKNYFNILMYSFLLIVPLIPMKAKILFFPLSADFIIGGFAILVGGIDLIVSYKKDKAKFSILKDKSIRILSILIIVFLVMSLGSIFYATSKTAVLSEALRFMEYVIIFYLILLNADLKFINRGLMLFYISMLVSSAFGIIQFAFNLSSIEVGGYLNRGRVYATFENPNYWGAAVNLIIFFPLISYIENKKDRKFYNLAIFVMLLSNLILSFTRGSWLGFALGLLFIVLIRYKKWLLSLPFIAGGAMLLPFVRKRLVSILQFQDTTLERIKLWKTGWYMFKDHFWMGVGNGNFLTYYPEYIKKHPTLTVYKQQSTVHNSYLKMFAELGILGGLIFTGIYGMLFYMSYSMLKRTRKYKVIVLAFLGFWIAFLFQNFLNNLMFIPQLNVFVWVITAMLYKGVYLENQEEKI